MESAEQERVLRRARRVLWAFRILFYGGALIALPVLLGLSGGDERYTFADGTTSQGRGFTLRFEHGRPVDFGAQFTATCRPAMDWSVRWWSFAGKNPRFRYHHGVLRVRETVARKYDNGWRGTRRYTLEARIDGDVVRGTMRYAETISHPRYPPYICASRDVGFSAG